MCNGRVTACERVTEAATRWDRQLVCTWAAAWRITTTHATRTTNATGIPATPTGSRRAHRAQRPGCGRPAHRTGPNTRPASGPRRRWCRRPARRRAALCGWRTVPPGRRRWRRWHQERGRASGARPQSGEDPEREDTPAALTEESPHRVRTPLRVLAEEGLQETKQLLFRFAQELLAEERVQPADCGRDLRDAGKTLSSAKNATPRPKPPASSSSQASRTSRENRSARARTGQSRTLPRTTVSDHAARPRHTRYRPRQTGAPARPR